jgi:hypothetical protein
MHPLFQNLQNHNLNEANPHAESHSTPHPFQKLADSFADVNHGMGRATEGPQESGTVTSFSAHMAPTFGNVKTRRGRK